MRYEADMSSPRSARRWASPRQAFSDGMTAARKKLEEYEEKLGLVRRYLAITHEAAACLTAADEGDTEAARPPPDQHIADREVSAHGIRGLDR